MKKTAVFVLSCFIVFSLTCCTGSSETVFSLEAFSSEISFNYNQSDVLCKLEFKSYEDITLKIEKPENLCGTLIKREHGKTVAIFEEMEIDLTNISLVSTKENVFENLFEILAVLNQNEYQIKKSSPVISFEDGDLSFKAKINLETNKIEKIDCGEVTYLFD